MVVELPLMEEFQLNLVRNGEHGKIQPRTAVIQVVLHIR